MLRSELTQDIVHRPSGGFAGVNPLEALLQLVVPSSFDICVRF